MKCEKCESLRRKPSWCQCWRNCPACHLTFDAHLWHPVTVLWPCFHQFELNDCAAHHTLWSSFGSTTRVQNHEAWKYNFQNCESHIGREGEPAWRAAFAVETAPEILFHRGDFPGALTKSSKRTANQLQNTCVLLCMPLSWEGEGSCPSWIWHRTQEQKLYQHQQPIKDHCAGVQGTHIEDSRRHEGGQRVTEERRSIYNTVYNIYIYNRAG